MHDSYLYLSIHEIRSDYRVGLALWSFNGGTYGHFHINDLELIKSTQNALGITFRAQFTDHWKLFDISTTDTIASDNFPLFESGRIEHDRKLKKQSWSGENSRGLSENFSQSEVVLNLVSCVPQVVLSPDTRILLNTDLEEGREDETIGIHYLDSGGTNFSFITRMSPSFPSDPIFAPELAFSADGSKFAMAISCGRVFVWDIRSKDPLKTCIENHFDGLRWPVRYLQFNSGNLAKEAMVFVGVRLMFTF